MIIPETWKIGLSAGIITGTLAMIGWLAIARANLKAELAKAQATYALCQYANDEWAAQAKAMNEAAMKWKKEAEKRHEKAIHAQNNAKKTAEKHAANAKEIMNAKEKGDTCEAAQKLIRQYLKDRK